MEEGKRERKTKRGQDKGSREGAHGEDWTGDDGDGLAGIRSSLRQDEGSLRNGSTALTPGPTMLAGPLHLRGVTERIGAWAMLLLAACFAPRIDSDAAALNAGSSIASGWNTRFSPDGPGGGGQKSQQALAGRASTGSP